MFLHVKSPLFREEVTDIIVKLSDIQSLDILKKNRQGKVCFVVLIITDDTKSSEIHETLESAQNRIAEIMQLCGETEERAKSIANDYLPEDRIERKGHSDLSHIISKAICESLSR